VHLTFSRSFLGTFLLCCACPALPAQTQSEQEGKSSILVETQQEATDEKKGEELSPRDGRSSGTTEAPAEQVKKVAGSSEVEVSDERSDDQVERVNRLATESSPYLLQHARNPVDWYPWGQDAFERAKRENKLVFLSVGYAACHWCHVMERESFEDEEIAAFLNENFICVKVDREERPDVDQIYMTAVQLISGNGGWPMSVFVLPDGKPFWGGTYFPARDGDRGNATGFLTVVQQIHQAWNQQSQQVTAQAEAVTNAIKEQQLTSVDLEAVGDFDTALVESALEELRAQFDSKYGGFASGTNGPKFPEASNLWFLHAIASIERSKQDRSNEPSASNETSQNLQDVASESLSAAKMLQETLDGMIRGGMYDHLGGGFHRYSVDGQWQIPHFEKMLYDNGQLASVYANASQLFGNDEYQLIAKGICDFMLREMRDTEGGFFSSIDADSEGEEGKYYRWDRSELKQFKSFDRYDDFANLYQLDGEPNFESLYYVLAPKLNFREMAGRRGQTIAQMLDPLESISRSMLGKRSERERPITDTKRLTAWNGLAIAGLADAGRVFGEKRYLRAAVTCLDFVMQHSRDPSGRLMRSYAKGKARLQGYLDDYAFVIAGILSLHRATQDERLLVMAAELMDEQIRWFWDQEGGGFFFTASDHPESIVRLKNPVDGATPSGISVSAENLLYLIQNDIRSRQQDLGLTYQDCLESTMRSVLPLLSRAPAAATRMAAVAVELETTKESP